MHCWHIALKCIMCYSMAATLFVQPLDLVKNRMQLSGQFSVFFCLCLLFWYLDYSVKQSLYGVRRNIAPAALTTQAANYCINANPSPYLTLISSICPGIKFVVICCRCCWWHCTICKCLRTFFSEYYTCTSSFKPTFYFHFTITITIFHYNYISFHFNLEITLLLDNSIDWLFNDCASVIEFRSGCNAFCVVYEINNVLCYLYCIQWHKAQHQLLVDYFIKPESFFLISTTVKLQDSL